MSTHYVYTVWSVDKRPIYVGCTNDVARRMREHERRSTWIGAANWVAVVEFPDRRSAEAAESLRIVKLRPRYNLRLSNASRPVCELQAEEMAYRAWSDRIDRMERAA